MLAATSGLMVATAPRTNLPQDYLEHQSAAPCPHRCSAPSLALSLASLLSAQQCEGYSTLHASSLITHLCSMLTRDMQAPWAHEAGS